MSWIFFGTTGSSFDPDALAFFAAAGITNPTQKSAVNQLTLDLKAIGWSKFKAIYPFVGGTASSHKWNLKDPRDLDVAFRIAWGYTDVLYQVTHTANGIFGNKADFLLSQAGAFGDTFLVPSVDIAYNDYHFAEYSRTGVTQQYGADIGVYPDSGGAWFLNANYNNPDFGPVFGTGSAFPTDYVQGSPLTTPPYGTFVGSANGATSTIYKDGASIGTNTPKTATSTRTLHLLSFNSGDGTGPDASARNLAFVSIGTGLDGTEADALTTAIVNFETMLGRQN